MGKGRERSAHSRRGGKERAWNFSGLEMMRNGENEEEEVRKKTRKTGYMRMRSHTAGKEKPILWRF